MYQAVEHSIVVIALSLASLSLCASFPVECLASFQKNHMPKHCHASEHAGGLKITRTTKTNTFDSLPSFERCKNTSRKQNKANSHSFKNATVVDSKQTT